MIGENDPDFEYDNFPLRSGDWTGGWSTHSFIAILLLVVRFILFASTELACIGCADEAPGVPEELPWYISIFRSMFGDDSAASSQGAGQGGGRAQGGRQAAPTKFTKLSMFKFRRELGACQCMQPRED